MYHGLLPSPDQHGSPNTSASTLNTSWLRTTYVLAPTNMMMSSGAYSYRSICTPYGTILRVLSQDVSASMTAPCLEEGISNWSTLLRDRHTEEKSSCAAFICLGILPSSGGCGYPDTSSSTPTAMTCANALRPYLATMTCDNNLWPQLVNLTCDYNYDYD